MSNDGLTVLVVLALIFVPIVGYNIVKMNSIEQFCDTVDEKWIKQYDGGSAYLISTENHGVLENTDEWIVFKFDSSDVYAKIKANETHCFKTIGWRVPFLSGYKNIIEVELDE